MGHKAFAFEQGLNPVGILLGKGGRLHYRIDGWSWGWNCILPKGGAVGSSHGYVPFTQQALSNKGQHSISYTLSRSQSVIVEYTQDSETDMFQVPMTSDSGNGMASVVVFFWQNPCALSKLCQLNLLKAEKPCQKKNKATLFIISIFIG